MLARQFSSPLGDHGESRTGASNNAALRGGLPMIVRQRLWTTVRLSPQEPRCQVREQICISYRAASDHPCRIWVHGGRRQERIGDGSGNPAIIESTLTALAALAT